MKRWIVCAFTTLLTAAASAPAAITTFENGLEGWVGPAGGGGSSAINPVDGNPLPSFRTVFNDFGITFRNGTNAGFVRDYTQTPRVEISLDVKVNNISFFGQDVSRNLILDLRDRTNPPGGYPYVSVWYNLGELREQPGWQHFSVTIEDTSLLALPAGWGGTGDESPLAEPRLPANRTFTNVLAGVDQIAFTTLEPGFFYGFTDFDVAVDNIRVEFTPEPSSLALFVIGVIACARRR